jgi:nuclear receptor subfamily 1 group I
MAKKLSAFKTLCQEDQIALLKGGCTELMILRSVMSYDADKGCWKVRKTLARSFYHFFIYIYTKKNFFYVARFFW